MRHPPRIDAARRHFPKLLYANAINLGIQAPQVLVRDKMLGQRAAGSLSEHWNLGAKLITWHEVVFRLSFLVTAFVFGNYAGDRFSFVNELRTGELRKDVDAFFLDKRAEPLHQLIQRDDVIAVIS